MPIYQTHMDLDKDSEKKIIKQPRTIVLINNTAAKR